MTVSSNAACLKSVGYSLVAQLTIHLHQLLLDKCPQCFEFSSASLLVAVWLVCGEAPPAGKAVGWAWASVPAGAWFTVQPLSDHKQDKKDRVKL